MSSAAAAETERQRMLLAAIGGGRRVAIPLDTVTRLEQVRADAVEKVGNREVVQYRGAILPIVRLDRHLGAYGETDREVLEVIVYADHGRSVAIVVEEILDIVDGEAAIRSDIDDLGLLGSAVLGDQVTELLDVRAAILAADPAFYSAPTALPPRHDARRRPRAPAWRSDVTSATDYATGDAVARPPAGSWPPSGSTATCTASRSSTCRRCCAASSSPACRWRRSAVAGLINLRGQVVTAIELRERLGRPARPEGTDAVVIVVRLRRRGGQPARRLDRRRRRRGRRATSRRRRTRSRARPAT